MATDGPDSLTDSKTELQELYGRRAELDKLIVLNGLRVLAPLLADVDLAIEFVKTAAPDQIKKLGDKAHVIAYILESLGLEAPVAPPTAPAETLELLVGAEVHEPATPIVAEEVAPLTEPAETQEEAASEEASDAQPEGISPQGEVVLAKLYGEDWRTVLDGLSLEDIAAKILEHEKIRLPNTLERALAITLGVLKGSSFEVIASGLTDTTASAASQYFRTMIKRAAAAQSSEPAEVAEETQPEVVASEPEEPAPAQEASEASVEEGLSKSALVFLGRFIEDDLSSLKPEDAEILIQKVLLAKKPKTDAPKSGRPPRADMNDIIAAALRGSSVAQLTKTYGPSTGAISAMLNGVAEAIVHVHGGKLTLEQLFALESANEPVEVLAAPVEEEPEIPIPEPMTVEERRRILRQSVEQPSHVSPHEWLEFAEIELLEAAQKAGFSAVHAEALWNRLHFSEDDRQDQPLDETSKAAIDELQRLFVQHSAELKGREQEIISMRAVTNTAYGKGSVRDALEALKRSFPTMTPNVAQRHVVAGALELMYAN